MSQRSGKSHVTFAKLQVCFADPGLDDIDDDFITAGRPEYSIAAELQRLIKYDGTHGDLFRNVDPQVVEIADVVK